MFEAVFPIGKNLEVYYDKTIHEWHFCGMIYDIYIHLDRQQPVCFVCAS